MEQDAHLSTQEIIQRTVSCIATVNKKVFVKMKDETARVPIYEFVGPKMYSLLYGGKEKRTDKSIMRV